MKAVLATALCICASASSSTYGGHAGNDDGCRDVKQERPVCGKHTRHVKEKFSMNDYKQKCHFEKKTKHDQVHLKVSKDVCKPHIEKVKSKHVVHINNKVCEEAKNGGYGDEGKKTPPKPDCKIVKEKRYIDGYDKVTKYSCHPEKDTKKVDVTLHYKKEVCNEYPERHDEYVTLEVTETKCHVEKYTRRVCDDGPFDDKNYQQGDYGNHDDGYGDHDKDGYGGKGQIQAGYGDGYGHEKSGYGDMGNSKKDDYGAGYGDHDKGGYGSKDEYGGYGDHDKGGYGSKDEYGGYGDHEKGGYGNMRNSKKGDYGSGSKDEYGGYGDHEKDGYGSGYGSSKRGYHDEGGYGASSSKGSYGGYGDHEKGIYGSGYGSSKGGYHDKGGYGASSSKGGYGGDGYQGGGSGDNDHGDYFF